MHILGYNIKDIEHIKKVMQDFALKNEIVVEEVINQLNKKGFDISVKKIRGYIDKCGLN